MTRSRPAALGIAVALASTAIAAEAPTTIDPNENLVVEGVPPIPAALAGTVGRYTEFRAATFQAWHPTRREMLVTTRFADAPQVHLVATPGGARKQLTFFSDRVGGASFPPSTGDFFVFAKDVGGDEFGQLYRYDLPGGAITLLTDGGRSRTAASAGRTAATGWRTARPAATAATATST